MFDKDRFTLHVNVDHLNKIQKELFSEDNHDYSSYEDNQNSYNNSINFHNLNHQIMKSILVDRPNKPY